MVIFNNYTQGTDGREACQAYLWRRSKRTNKYRLALLKGDKRSALTWKTRFFHVSSEHKRFLLSFFWRGKKNVLDQGHLSVRGGQR